MFITYIILDPRFPGSLVHPLGELEFKPVYVGKGRPDRPYHIISLFEGSKNIYSGRLINDWIQEMKDLGYKEVPIVVVYNGDEVTAFAYERVLTKHFGLLSENGILLNSRHGGDGGWSLSPESKALLSELNSGPNNPNFGKRWTEERRQKQISAWKSKDRSRTPESMANCWASMRRTYLIKDPNGASFEVSNLTMWCQEKGLPLSSFRKALKAGGSIRSSDHGKKSSVHGWSIQYIDEKN